MSLNPPPRWALYRGVAQINGRLYRVPPRWCVTERFHDPILIGPTEDDRVSVASAIDAGLLQYIGDAESDGVVESYILPTGYVECRWRWSPEKGLLTQDELFAGLS